MRSAALLLSILLIKPSHAGTRDLRGRQAIIERLQKCVFVASARDGEANLVAEDAFLACKTEEDALRTWLALNSVPPGIAEAFIIHEKLEMKAVVIELNRRLFPTR
jgi:hypothetical protein